MNNLTQPNRFKSGFEAVFCFILIIVLSYLFRLHFGLWFNADWHVLLYSRFIFWSIVGVLFVYTYKTSRGPFLLWKEQSYTVKFYIISIGVMYLLYILEGIVASVPLLFGVHDNKIILLKMIQLMNKSIWLAIFGAITAGITEELIFRGFILPRLQIAFNSAAAAIMLSSLMFSSLHYTYHSLRELIATFLIGLMFAIHYQKYRNIKIIVIAHFIIDMIAFLIGRHLVK